MGQPSGFAQLEFLVRELTRRYGLLQAENEALHGRLEVKEHQLSVLEAESGEAEARRKNAIDRLDQLIEGLDVLEQRTLGSTGKAPRSSPLTVQNAPPGTSG